MRFAATHKVVSYLMVTTAFLVLALSGELPPELTVLTAAGIASSFFFDPQRYPFMNHWLYRHGWNVAMLGLLALSILAWLRGEPLLAVGTRFLCYLLLAKLWNRKGNRDYLHAYIVSFFMLVAGSVLNNNLIYALCFVGYVVFTTWTLTLFHLRREMEENYLLKHVPSRDGKSAESERVEVDRILNSRRVVGGAFLLGTSLISLAIFLASGVIFITIPRVGFGLDIPLQRHGLTVSGFSDRIELGGHGRIRDNPQVVLRVEIPSGKPERPLYFRGVTFDAYDRGRWSRSKRITPQRFNRYNNYHLLDYTGPPLTWGRLQRVLASTLRTEIYLEPLDTPVLFAPSRVVAVAPPEALFPGATMRLSAGPGGEIFAPERKAGLRYSTYSDVAPPSERQLQAAPDLPVEHEEELDVYLEVPQSLPEPVRALARRLTRDAAGPHGKAMALLRHLQGQYAYTTDLRRDERYEPLEDFLFVQKRGHCEYFSSALAMMLRVAGVPSRSVNGYLGGEWNEYGRYLVVRQQNAHSWVEAYITGVGWVTYDATPPSALPVPEEGILSAIRQLTDTVELAWFKYVIEYDLRTQMRMAEGAISWLQKSPMRRRGFGLRTKLKQVLKGAPFTLTYGLATVSVLCLGAALYMHLRRQRGPSIRRRQQRTDHLLQKALHFLRRRGFTQRPAETLRQLAARVGSAGDPAAPPFDRLIGRYYAVRFGQEPVDLEELQQLTRSVLSAPPRPPEPPAAPT